MSGCANYFRITLNTVCIMNIISIYNLSLFVMFTSQLNQSTKNHQVEKKSLLTPYSISGILFGFKKQKPSKQIVSRVFKWAQMDSNHRPSDYESDALTNWAMGPNSGYKFNRFYLVNQRPSLEITITNYQNSNNLQASIQQTRNYNKEVWNFND